MHRFLVALSLLLGLGIAAPATAAPAQPQITLASHNSSPLEGSGVNLSGRITGSAQRRVELQHRTSDAWELEAKKKADDAGRFSFLVTPSRGTQKYRVVLPRRGASPLVSKAATLRVTWQPTVTTTPSESHDLSTLVVTESVDGVAPGLGGALLDRELKAGDGTWASTATVTVGPDGTFTDTFPVSHGQRWRYHWYADGSRLPGTSQAFEVDGTWTPTITVTDASMDSPAEVAHVTGSTGDLRSGSTSVLLEYWTGQEWSPATTEDVQTGGAGNLVDVRPDGTIDATIGKAVSGRTYRLAWRASGQGDPRTDVTSAPFTIADGPVANIPLNSKVFVEVPEGASNQKVHLTLNQGQDVTFWHDVQVTNSRFALIDPDGSPVSGFDGSPAFDFTAAKTGQYTLTMSRQTGSPVLPVVFSTPLLLTTELDADPMSIDGIVPGRRIEVAFQGAPGQIISDIDGAACCDHEDRTLYSPSGQAVPRFGHFAREGHNWMLPNEAGTYRIVFDRLAQDQSSDGTKKLDGYRLLTANRADLVPGGDPVVAHFDVPGRLVVLSMQGKNPQALGVSAAPAELNDNPEFLAPNGASTTTEPAPGSTLDGTYYLILSRHSGETAPDSTYNRAGPRIKVTSATMDSLDVSAHVTGQTEGIDVSAPLALQYWTGQEWQAARLPWNGDALDADVNPDGTIAATITYAEGARSYRLAGHADNDPNAEVFSNPFTIVDGPVATIPVDSKVVVLVPKGISTRSVHVDLEADEEVTFWHDHWMTNDQFSLTDPDGEPVAGFTGGSPFDLTAPKAGPYTLTMTGVGENRVFSVAFSTPLILNTQVDAAPMSIDGVLPGRRIEVAFHGEPGQVISDIYSTMPCCDRDDRTLYSPSGQVVPRFGQAAREGHNWMLPNETGEYRVVFDRIPDDTSSDGVRKLGYYRLLLAARGDLVPGGDPVIAHFDMPGRLVVLSVQGHAGQDLNFTAEPADLDDPSDIGDNAEYIAPDGTSTTDRPDHLTTVDGIYYLVLSRHSWQMADSTYYATSPSP